MLHKKIYPQRPSPETTTPKKYLDMPETDSTDEEDYEDASDHKSKWVKTDSECKCKTCLCLPKICSM